MGSKCNAPDSMVDERRSRDDRGPCPPVEATAATEQRVCRSIHRSSEQRHFLLGSKSGVDDGILGGLIRLLNRMPTLVALLDQICSLAVTQVPVVRPPVVPMLVMPVAPRLRSLCEPFQSFRGDTSGHGVEDLPPPDEHDCR